MRGRRRLMPEVRQHIFRDAYVYYPFKGDLKDYSGNGRDIINSSYATINSNSITITDKYGYLETPFSIENCGIGTTMSCTVSPNSDFTNFYRKALWGVLVNWMEGTYCIFSTGTGGIVTTLGQYDNDYLRCGIANNEKHNYTVVRESNSASVYVDGVLAATKPIINNLPDTVGYHLFVGNMNNKGYGADQYGFGGEIYGFAYFKRVLTNSEIRELSKSLI